MIYTIVSKLLEPTKKGTYAYQMADIRLEVYVKITFAIGVILNGIVEDKKATTVISIAYLSILLISLLIGVYGAIVLRNEIEPTHQKHIYSCIVFAILYVFAGVYIYF